jgi:protein-tyrosine phosphatase
VTTTDVHPPIDQRRHVVLEQGFNMRDLGGYPVRGGGEVRWGRLFRAGSLSTLSGADVERFRQLGIRTVVDLRSDRELDERGRLDVDSYPCRFVHLPVIDATWQETGVPDFDGTEDGTVAFLVWAYESMLEQGADRFGAAIRALAIPGSLPAVFHCAAGKDRTGILAALVLAGIGVDDVTVATDYGLSEQAMASMMAWAEANDPERVAALAAMPPAMRAARPAAMLEILARLRHAHGSIDGFLASIGVGTATMSTLTDALVDRG